VLLPRIAHGRLRFVEGMAKPGHDQPRPGRSLLRKSEAEGDEVTPAAPLLARGPIRPDRLLDQIARQLPSLPTTPWMGYLLHRRTAPLGRIEEEDGLEQASHYVESEIS
jgi:hypothetical protein